VGMSDIHEFWFTSKDGLRIACRRWDSRGPARGVVQIAHGIGEHSGRYSELIAVLQEANFVLVLSGSGSLDTLEKLAISALAKKYNFLNARFEPARALFDWLSRDSRVVGAFVNDPLEGVRTLIDRYGKAAVSDGSHDFYEGGRHEMLNELNRGEVRTSLLVSLSKVLRDQSHHSEALWARQHQHH
jgi:alpha-beta hydrolase superfamily lysophospholipase